MNDNNYKQGLSKGFPPQSLHGWPVLASLVFFLALRIQDSSSSSGLYSGFNHPFQGWDHIITMIAVGMWAAQMGGRAIWMLPLTFVSVMTAGGLAGTVTALPSAELMILLSTLVFSGIISCKVRFSTRISILIVAFFAFFHGFAHGQEISASASLLSYAFGFVIATLILHGAGILTSRLLPVIVACLIGGGAHAQEAETAPQETTDKKISSESTAKSKGTVELEEMTIVERADSQLGIADSASQGNVGQAQLKYRPITRPSEVLETVPGLISTQHSGEGKASQYFLRGFNLDHGTDFLTQIEGVPVNQLSHSHGQGWTDTNFLIPELIETLDYKKGNNYAENGDFSSTGSANIHYFKSLPDHILKFTGGSFDYYRGLAAGSIKAGDGNLLYGFETVHNNGPWTVGNDYMKFNGVLKYSEEHEDYGWSVTGMAYKADWNSTDQVPQGAVQSGLIDRFGTLDPTDGGNSQRYSLTAEWHRQNADSETKLMAYGIYNTLNLFSNFTFLLDDPNLVNPVTGDYYAAGAIPSGNPCAGLNGTLGKGQFNPSIFNTCGDQFGQPDDRWTTGFKGSHTFFHKIGDADSETTIGLQIRNDNIQNKLTKTHAQKQWDLTRADTMWVTSISPYAENKTRWNDWFRSTIGVRFDGFRFDVSNSNIAANANETYAGLVSPKLGFVFGPWANTEFYLNGGLGYHSNDARGVNTTIEPGTGARVTPATPLVRTYSAEVGARTTWVKGLQSTLAIWWLDIDSELVFIGDAGTTEAGRPSRRFGLEFANYYSPTDWLTFDADFSFSHARFRNHVDGEGNHIPGSVESVIAAGATFHDVWGGLYGGPRIRYFGPRDLEESGRFRSEETLLLSATLGYEVNKHLSFQAEVFNILNRKDPGITYYYESRYPDNNGGYTGTAGDYHFHPVEPVSFRMGFTAKF